MQRTKIKRNKKQHRLRTARKKTQKMHRSSGGARTEKEMKEQTKALETYLTSFNYASINGYLRNDPDLSEEEKKDAMQVVEHLDKFFEEDEQVRIDNEPFQVYRGLRNKDGLSHFDFIGLQKSYLSTSLDIGFVIGAYAGGYIMVLNVQPGVPYLNVELTGLAETEEEEILFPRGVYINLVSMTENGTEANKMFNRYNCSALYCTITKDPPSPVGPISPGCPVAPVAPVSPIAQAPVAPVSPITLAPVSPIALAPVSPIALAPVAPLSPVAPIALTPMPRNTNLDRAQAKANRDRACPPEKEINPSTNRCVKKCPEGKHRNDQFKCVNNTAKAKPKCPPEKEINPATNRCVKKCPEGKHRNEQFKCVKTS